MGGKFFSVLGIDLQGVASKGSLPNLWLYRIVSPKLKVELTNRLGLGQGAALCLQLYQ